MSFSEQFLTHIFGVSPKFAQAKKLIWYSEYVLGREFTSPSEISDMFAEAKLPRPNTSRLARELRSDKKNIISRDDEFHLRADVKRILNAELAHLVNEPEVGLDITKILEIPFLTNEEVAAAIAMAHNYVYIHCLENSVRKLISSVLAKDFGVEWWSLCSDTDMRRKIKNRREAELSKKWAPSRLESNPLYGLDWIDLAKLIKKYDNNFSAYIGDPDFVHRFEDLNALRNVVAHNGFFTDEQDAERIKWAWRDWIKQIGEKLLPE